MYPVEVDLSKDFVPEVVISSFLNPDSSVKVLVGSNQIAFSKTIIFHLNFKLIQHLI